MLRLAAPAFLRATRLPSISEPISFLSSSSQSEPPTDDQARKTGGILSSIFYGSPSAKAELSDTFSKVLARGKSEYYPKLAKQDPSNLKLCGSWLTSIGELDSAVHIWEYTGYTGHNITRERLMQDEQYKTFERRLRPLINKRTSKIMLEFAFWATAAPHTRGGCFELRTYMLKPGRMLEWEVNWRKGLECRRQFCEPVGAWFSQLGQLNVVNHMWQYP